MKTTRLIVGLIVVFGLGLAVQATGQGPVKWSVPLHEYPRPWAPTMAPPPQPQAYPYPYGYQGPGVWPGMYNQGSYYGYPPSYPQWYQQGAYSGYPPQPMQ
jgi:hypothetical protein